MKTSFSVIIKSITCSVLVMVSAASCKAQEAVSPKSGKIEIPAKGNLTLWAGKHGSFRATFSNPNEKAAVELYTGKGGRNKWISPSLLAKKSITVKVAEDGYVFIENYNSSKIEIEVEI